MTEMLLKYREMLSNCVEHFIGKLIKEMADELFKVFLCIRPPHDAN